MSIHQPRNAVTPCLCESLEARLLLSADLPAAFDAQIMADVSDASLAVFVPAEVEQESAGGSSNNDLVDAQPLEFYGIFGNDTFGPQQAVVTGTADGLGGGGESYFDSTMLFGLIAYPSVYPIDMINAITPGTNGVLTITAKADLGGTDRFLTLEAEGVVLGDVFVDVVESFSTVNAQVTIPQAQLAALAADGTVELTVTPSDAVAGGQSGYLIVELGYEGPASAGTADYYSMDLVAGESASLSVAGDGPLDLALVDAEGTVLAEGAVGGFVAEQSGAYYARITGEGDYCLLANRNGVMDDGDNDSPDAAQPVVGPRTDGRQWVVGSLTGDESGADSDFYSVELSGGGRVELRMTLPAAQADAVIRLYDAAGNVVAESTQRPNRTVVLDYRVPKSSDGGEYSFELAADSDSQVDYIVSVRNQAPAGGQAKKGDAGAARGKAAQAANTLDLLFGGSGRRLR